MAMFLMSLTNFGDYYVAFEKTKHEYEAKVCKFILKSIILHFLFIIAPICCLYGHSGDSSY